MRITCPYCGERDVREFTYRCHALALNRPAPDAGEEAWDDYVHLRDNPAGPTEDLWYHNACGTWTKVSRDTVSHAVSNSIAVAEVKR